MARCWREDMNFMFEWHEQYLTSERSERVRYCSFYYMEILNISFKIRFYCVVLRTVPTN